MPPKVIGEVIGVVKSYTTRVGDGPFPTELKDVCIVISNNIRTENGSPKMKKFKMLIYRILAISCKHVAGKLASQQKENVVVDG